MLKSLRFRLILFVILMLFVISAGIVFAINIMNERQISTSAFEALDLLSRNDGRRLPLQRPDDKEPPSQSSSTSEHNRKGDSNRAFLRPWLSVRTDLQASFGNYTVVSLSNENTVISVSTDRDDLYTETELNELIIQIISQKSEQGQIGRQYYTISAKKDGTRQLIILDNRLSGENAKQVLAATVIVAACAWLLLSLGAVLLISRMLRPVEEAFTKQRQFVSDASHELKTPLAVISANAQALVREQGHNEQTDYILSEVSRADSLVRNLLSLARLDQAAPQTGFQDFDLSQALLSVILPFESTVFEAGRTLESDIPDNIRYYGHEEMIKQLTVILLSNALKYSDENGKIRLKLEAHGNRRILTIFNTGDGISPENRSHVFDRFWREDSSHNSAVSGHGLGLSIAKSIVDLHKGRITAGGEWHKNAVFTVTL